MSLLQRINTLWVLSGWNLTNEENPNGFKFTGILKPQNQEEPPKQAQIIKMKSPVQEFLTKNKDGI